ncbi:MAG: hypothetical protein ACOYXR_06310 [Nitrospirota bacterium]
MGDGAAMTPEEKASDVDLSELGEEAMDSRQDIVRTLRQALDAIDGAIEKARAAADHADDTFGNPNPVSVALEDLLGMLCIWSAAASMLLDDVDGDR